MGSKLANNKPEMSERETDVYSMRDLTTEVLRPERVMLEFEINDKKKILDIGSICYLKRGRINRYIPSNRCRPDDVQLSSFSIARRELVRSIIDDAITSGKAVTSTSTYLKGYLEIIRWCDLNGHEKAFLITDKTRDAYIKYSEYLTHLLVVKNSISLNRASYLQGLFSRLIAVAFNSGHADYIANSAPRIIQRKSIGEAPEEENVARYKETCWLLAKQISKFLMRSDPHPLLLKMQGYSTYCFPKAPNAISIKTPYSVTERHHTFNFDEGRISTVEEHLEKSKQPYRRASKKAIIKAQEVMDTCSKDPRHKINKSLAITALQSYASLFVMLTGANPEQFVNLEYSEALELVNSPIKKEFTTVKMRARGKIVRIPIGRKEGQRLLKEYLLYRDWVLNGEKSKWLFFSLKGDCWEAQKLSPLFQSEFFKTKLKVKYLPEEFKNISPSSVRKYKSVSMHSKGVKPEVVAGVLGHTSTTNLKHYSEPTRKQHGEEFKLYWDSILKAAESTRIMESRKDEGGSSTTVGHCDNFGAPSSVSESPPIEPNCQTQYGCLYCKHYICHSDEEDVLKLLSLQYVMKEVRSQADNPEHADKLLQDLCVRVSVIINEISSGSKELEEMVGIIKKQVFDLGLLTPFWEARLSKYEQMGVII